MHRAISFLFGFLITLHLTQVNYAATEPATDEKELEVMGGSTRTLPAAMNPEPDEMAESTNTTPHGLIAHLKNNPSSKSSWGRKFLAGASFFAIAGGLAAIILASNNHSNSATSSKANDALTSPPPTSKVTPPAYPNQEPPLEEFLKMLKGLNNGTVQKKAPLSGLFF